MFTKMRVLTFSTLLVVAFGGTTRHKETFEEKLTVWPMQKGFSLLEFYYDFKIDFSSPDEKMV